MKKVLLLAILIALSSLSCKATEDYDHLNLLATEEPIVNMYPVKTYFNNNVYTVVIFKGTQILSGVDFSSDRQASNMVGLELVVIEDIQSYLGKTLEDVEKTFGDYHVDIGSGHSMPAYITSDGYLVCFSISNDSDIICHVGRTDLFSGKAVEWYFVEEIVRMEK